MGERVRVWARVGMRGERVWMRVRMWVRCVRERKVWVWVWARVALLHCQICTCMSTHSGASHKDASLMRTLPAVPNPLSCIQNSISDIRITNISLPRVDSWLLMVPAVKRFLFVIKMNTNAMLSMTNTCTCTWEDVVWTSHVLWQHSHSRVGGRVCGCTYSTQAYNSIHCHEVNGLSHRQGTS